MKPVAPHLALPVFAPFPQEQSVRRHIQETAPVPIPCGGLSTAGRIDIAEGSKKSGGARSTQPRAFRGGDTCRGHTSFVGAAGLCVIARSCFTLSSYGFAPSLTGSL